MADTMIQSVEDWMTQRCKEINCAFKALQNALASRHEALHEECDVIATNKVKAITSGFREDDVITMSLDHTVLVSAISRFGTDGYTRIEADKVSLITKGRYLSGSTPKLYMVCNI